MGQGQTLEDGGAREKAAGRGGEGEQRIADAGEIGG